MDNYIDTTAIIKRDLVIGDHNAVDAFFYCTVPLEIGNYVHISSHVSVIGGNNTKLTMEDFSFIATGSRIICASEDYTTDSLIGPLIPAEMKVCHYKPVVFEKYSGVGANCVILPGVRLGMGSVVGANSLVTKDTEPWGIYVGSPAKLVKYRKHDHIEEYALFMKNDLSVSKEITEITE